MKFLICMCLLLPALTFACPNFSGSYVCDKKSQNLNSTQLLKMVITSAADDQMQVTYSLYGFHLVDSGGGPFSGHWETSAFTRVRNYKVGTHTSPSLSGVVVTTTTICDGDSLNSKTVVNGPGDETTYLTSYTEGSDEKTIIVDDDLVSLDSIVCIRK
jgi:hypothetical protein